MPAPVAPERFQRADQSGSLELVKCCAQVDRIEGEEPLTAQPAGQLLLAREAGRLAAGTSKFEVLR